MQTIYTNVAKTQKEKKAAAINCAYKSKQAYNQNAHVYNKMSARIALVQKAFSNLYANKYSTIYPVTYRPNTIAKNPFVAIKISNPTIHKTQFESIRANIAQFNAFAKHHNCVVVHSTNTNSIIVRVMSK
jgi:hypothetical protein|tara:strand:- start:102 stop:491 length:390 start_codon:yes stop_codon:yes gene_type:complete